MSYNPRLALYPPRRQESRTSTVHTIPITLNDGTEAVLGERFGGKVLLVVNVASQCGLTPQYEGLEELYNPYARGPSGPRRALQPVHAGRSRARPEIGEFCKANYGVTFPLAAKAEVNGEDAHPLYQELDRRRAERAAEDIPWNFEKFLVGRDGAVIARFAPRTEPLSAEVTAAVRAAL